MEEILRVGLTTHETRGVQSLSESEDIFIRLTNFYWDHQMIQVCTAWLLNKFSRDTGVVPVPVLFLSGKMEEPVDESWRRHTF